jgi:APA family basic amino acid/polyamine antiporter
MTPSAPPGSELPRAPQRLLRVLGVGFGLAVVIGSTIGSGILRTPGEIAARLPHPALFLGAWAPSTR